MELARPCLEITQSENEAVAAKCQVSAYYLSSIEGRGATRSSELRIASSDLPASSVILIPSVRTKREYYFAIVWHLWALCPRAVPPNRNQRLVDHFILMRKMRKLRPGLARSGELMSPR